MNTCKLTLAALVLATGLAPAAQAEVNGGLPGEWLSRYSGARSAGMGGAFVASQGDPMGALWNPASITGAYQNTVSLESVQLFESTSITGLGFVAPARRLPSFGFTMLALRSGEFQRTSELNEDLGDFSNGDTAFLMTLGKALSRELALGFNLKYVRQSIEEYSAGGVGLDMGVQWRPHRKLLLGASVLNVGGPNMTLRQLEEPYPMEMRAGFGLELLNGRALLTGELDSRGDGGGNFLRGGTEVWVHESVALRLGYDDAAAGGGLTYRMPTGWDFHYGAQNHELGVTHRFALSYRFGGFFASSQALPAVFSPTGRNAVTRFQLESRTRADATTWELEVVDPSGMAVRSFGGPGSPPVQVVWDGKDASGLPLSDGIYEYTLVVSDAEGHVLESRTRNVEILSSGPSGQVPVSLTPERR